MISGTVFTGGVTLLGQSVEAFYTAVEHFPALSVGFNFALGPKQIKPYLETLSSMSTKYTSWLIRMQVCRMEWGDLTPAQVISPGLSIHWRSPGCSTLWVGVVARRRSTFATSPTLSKD